MYIYHKHKAVFLVSISAMGLVLAGCGEEQRPPSSPDEETPQMIQRQAPERQQPGATDSGSTIAGQDDFRVMPKIDGSLKEDGMGLETIIDASSKQAYADSLQWISEDVSQDQFNRLESSIRYIHMYDSSVLGDESKLLTLVDGKTGTEIIEHASRLQKQRRGN